MAKYMVVYINIHDGKIEEVYGADTLSSELKPAESIPKDEKEKKPLSLYDVVSLVHYGIIRNPTCRIIEHNGILRVVCDG